MFTHGVSADYETLGDSRNYLSFLGILSEDIESKQVAAVDIETNIVLGIAEVDENGEFYLYSNMQGAGDRNFIFIYDESVKIPYVEEIDELNSIVEISFVDNKKAIIDDGEDEIDNSYQEDTSSKSQEDVSENTNNEFYVGDSIMFDSGIIVNVNNIELTNEDPNGEVQGLFVRVDFTIDNQTTEEIRVSGHGFSLYDGERNKAVLDSKDFYLESIAPGMKSTGSAYFDSIEEGPYTVMVEDASWIEKN